MKKTARKVLAASLSVLLITVFLGCGQQKSNPAPSVTPPTEAAKTEPVKTEAPLSGATFATGTYTAVAEGRNGPVKIEVTFSEKKIESIRIISQTETERYGDAALEEVKDKILSAQSLAVDGVSGATESSRAMFVAVEKAVKQAGGDVQILKAKE